MASKKTPKQSKRKKSTPLSNTKSFKYTLLGFIAKLIFALIIISVLGLLLLDTHIRKQFEGKRWEVPAKVYARPLELYPGLPISIADLKIELKGLGYQFVSKVRQPGQAEFSSTRARITTRGFNFPDGKESAQTLLLTFDNNYVVDIKTIQNQPIALTRLEPVLIGGIYPLNNEDRDLIQLSDAPKTLKEALIAIEDRSFYQHHGISFRGISRAMMVNIKAGRFIQGGSTLTQQLIKNFYLTSDRTLVRKLMEIPMALLLELHYSKDEILQAYLNEVYLGQSGARAIHGFGLASQYYFAQPISELKLHQVALLAGLVKGPSYYEPRRHPKRAKARRDLVLNALLQQDSITEKQYQHALHSPLGVVKQASLLKGAYPAYLDLVKRQLRQDYRDEDLSSEGLRIFTALNPISQYKAEQALVSTLSSLEKGYGKQAANLQGSMVVTEAQTGEVLAIIGGKHTRYQGFNRALDAVRPIGSLVKPAVYLAALQQGYTLISPLDDAPISIELPNGEPWQPENFDRESHGNVELHTALANSYNLSTVRLGMEVGLSSVIATLNDLGITRPLAAYPSLLLGAQAMSSLDLASMYQTIAANGFQMPLRAIRMVTDSKGQELSRYSFKLQQTVNPAPMHLLQYALQETARIGTARSIYNQIPHTINVAGKTGTSDQQRDSWFAGFTGNRVAVTWIGRDDNASLPFTGSSGALKAWTQYIASDNLQSFNSIVPDGVEYHWVNASNGMLSDESCNESIQVPFLSHTAPTEIDPCSGLSNGNNPLKQSFDWIKQWF